MQHTVTVKQRQTLSDIALQYCGSYTAIAEIARLNGMSPTEQPPPGRVLRVPPPYDPDVVAYYKSKSIEPASGQAIKQGIGFDAVEQTTIVYP